jgi:4-aminobutyrate aminotransferase
MAMGANHMATFASNKFKGGAKLAHFTPNFIRVPAPYYYRPFFEVTVKDNIEEVDRKALEALEMQIKYGSTGPVCALLMEPLQASGGQLIFSQRYLKGVKDICSKYNIILIWDCIQTAFGRMGTWSASEYYGVTPDIMVLGKSMGSGFPINAVAISDDIEGVTLDWIDAHTFANNQVSQVAALAQIEIIARDNILENVKTVGSYLKENLLKIQKDYEQIGDVRAIGFHIGVEFVKDRHSRKPDGETVMKIRKAGLENGIIFGLGGTGEFKNVLKIKPPLITTKLQADDILEKFELCVKEAIDL